MRTLGIIAIATFCAATGDAFLSKGMKQFGDVSAFGLSQPWKILGMFSVPWIWVGVCFAAGYFFLYTSALSWSDLSFAQPLTAMSYIYATLIARFAFKEHVGPLRWLGVLAIVAGVVLISQDTRRSPAP
ncbi:MAG: EamA family transporter [Elusimicrobiota bacterium]|jgi:undecaprenyl phosphate-alpha-L-ara4N flippase subunit ArnE